MLLFGDAFGPAYAIFLCFCIQLCSLFLGSNFKKCFQQAITLLYGRFRRSQQCCVQGMCVQQYVCVYAKYTICVHTAVRPRNIPRNIKRMTGCCWDVTAVLRCVVYVCVRVLLLLFCCCFLTLTDPLRIQPWSQDRRNQTKSNRESEMSMESIQKRTGKK